jgi:hypothetical protein
MMNHNAIFHHSSQVDSMVAVLEAGGNVLSSDKVFTHPMFLNTLHIDFYFAVKHLNVI